MAELESAIEKSLIDKLCHDTSQWTYRPDIKTEKQLWDNFKYILEQNNKAKLNDVPLTESEFNKIKNDISHASFYEAGKWLSGENGKVYVDIQRGNEPIHLLVMNNEHICGGTSVYEVINQYQAFTDVPNKTATEEATDDTSIYEVINQYQAFATGEGNDVRDRRFDVTLLINGIPLIHIELKNKNHSYMDGYRQIKKYISEGKFHGIFSNIQMFVVSNVVDTKYFSAARDTELNKKFISGWLDEHNNPVCNYIDFADSVLRIPQAHKMVANYTVLDNEARQLLLLRPYQIHAIEAIRSASKQGKSGYIWHTTGSGKTMTSYKAARNLLMDIPSIEKTIFLIDRKDLDTQTKVAFQSYADNDTIDVDDTDHVGILISRLTDKSRQMIVTTRQKLQIMINKRLKEGDKNYEKIRNLHVAFVVDECHRAVTPATKRKIEEFFSHSLWYGFTGTPILDENSYEKKGDLPQTTKQLYGECLHPYTIKEAIHDEAVLGFMVENLGPKEHIENPAVFGSEAHMRQVLDVILNHSASKFGLQRGKGRTFEGILTVSSIPLAQKYYKLLKRIKEGNDELKISDKIHQALPDFPKFAITYSLSEDKEDSKANQLEMQESLNDYGDMFGTYYKVEEIATYNNNLNDRLARKEKKYLKRSEQLDLVIVVDRLLTGFDAPQLSVLFIDRQPMNPQNIIQAFSRTNRLLDDEKQYGQIVTFQSPDEFKDAIDNALRLYSLEKDGADVALAEDWDKVSRDFKISVNAIHVLAEKPADVSTLSKDQKRSFVQLFRTLDHDFAHLKAFSRYSEDILDSYMFSEEEYEDYAAMYRNVIEELRSERDPSSENEADIDDYDLIAYHKIRVNFEYIVQLLQGFVDSLHPEKNNSEQSDFQDKIKEIREMVDEYSQSNQKMGDLLNTIVDEIEKDRLKYLGDNISEIITCMRDDAITKEINAFAEKWFIPPKEVLYHVEHFHNGMIDNETNLKKKANYAEYKVNVEHPMIKFQFYQALIESFKNELMESILPLLN